MILLILSTVEPLRMTGTWAQVEDGKDGKPVKGKPSEDCARNFLGRPAWEGSEDEQWRPAGRYDGSN